MPQRPLEFAVSSAEIRGARNYQEDCTRTWQPDGAETARGGCTALLAVLADGMGGHVSGEVASKLVCEASIKQFSTEVGEPGQRIASALEISNRSLEQAIKANGKLSGMGCTAIIAWLDASGLQWASVGDSLLMVYRNNLLYRVNDDHSLGALLDKQAEANVITAEDAAGSPNRHSLRSALTGGQIALIDLERRPLALLPGDWVVLASDGLETLKGDDIASIAQRHGAGEPTDLARKLLEEVGRRANPSQDNTSVIAIRVLAGAEETSAASQRAGLNGNAAASDTHVGDTEVMRIRGKVIGQARPLEPVPPTVLIRTQHRSSRRRSVMLTLTLGTMLIASAVAALALNPQLAEMIQSQIRHYVTGGGDSKPIDPEKKPPEKAQNQN